MHTNRNDMDSPLKKLTHSTDIDNMTRKHQLAMNGHVGHGRNLTQSINFTEELNGFSYQPGWGLNNSKLA